MSQLKENGFDISISAKTIRNTIAKGGVFEKLLFSDTKRTTVYYAHPYCSGERGTNENSNRLIRKWIPKGIHMTNITEKFVQEIED